MAGKIKAALLVDADNLPIAQAEEALEKLAEICNPVIKKAFGDFTKSAKNWSPEFMRKHGFTPEMHFAVSNFKNGADIAMCIAAMDIVYAKSVEAIVLFTSDSDFASLATRIREAGLEAVGVGDAKASAVLRGAFDHFVVLEPPKKSLSKPLVPAPKPVKAPPKPVKVKPKLIVDRAPPTQKTKAEALNEQTKPLQNITQKSTKKPAVKAAKHPLKIPSGVRAEIIHAVTQLAPASEPVLLAKVHALIKERVPTFDFNALNFGSLSMLFKSIVELDVVNDNRKVRLVKGAR